jgi:chorismate mutase
MKSPVVLFGEDDGAAVVLRDDRDDAALEASGEILEVIQQAEPEPDVEVLTSVVIAVTESSDAEPSEPAQTPTESAPSESSAPTSKP